MLNYLSWGLQVGLDRLEVSIIFAAGYSLSTSIEVRSNRLCAHRRNPYGAQLNIIWNIELERLFGVLSSLANS